MSADSHPQSTFDLRILLVLSFGHLATDMYQSALPAILPLLKAKLLLSYTMAGILLLASNITSSVIQPVFGYLSDQKEKAFLLPAGCLCAGLALSLLSIPSHYEIVFLLVILSGLGIASYHPEGFKTERSFTGEKMATGMSVFTVGGNLGLALGPLAATFITAYFGFDYLPLMLVFSLAFLALLASSWRLLAPVRPRSVARGGSHASPPKAAYVSVGLTAAAVIMRSWTVAGLMAYIPFYYTDFEKGDPLYAGTLVSVFLLGGAIGTLIGSASSRPMGTQPIPNPVFGSDQPLTPTDLCNARSYAICDPGRCWHGTDFQLYGHYDHGPGAAAQQSGHRFRSYGRFRHWNGRNRRNPSRYSC